MTTKKIITADEFYNHDCKAGPEHGCETCALWDEQNKKEVVEDSDNADFSGASDDYGPTWTGNDR